MAFLVGKLLRPFSPWRPVVESPPAIRSCEEQELGWRFGIQGNRRRIFLESRRCSRVQPACSRSCRREGQREGVDEVCDPPHRWPVCPADTCHGFIWLSWTSGWLATLTRDSCHRSCLQLRSRYSPGPLATVPAALLAQPWDRRAWLRDAPRARSPGGFSGPSHSVPPQHRDCAEHGDKTRTHSREFGLEHRSSAGARANPRANPGAPGTRRECGGEAGLEPLLSPRSWLPPRAVWACACGMVPRAQEGWRAPSRASQCWVPRAPHDALGARSGRAGRRKLLA